MRRLWVDCRMAPGWGPVTRKTKPWLEDWNSHPHPSPILLESEKRWRRSQWSITPVWWSLHKNFKSAGILRASRFERTRPHQEGDAPHLLGETEAPVLKTLLGLVLRVLTPLSICTFHHILSATAKVRKCFPEFCEPLQQINWTQGGVGASFATQW